MSKVGIIKKKSLEINGILDVENKGIEVNGETLPLEELLKDFDGYDIKIVLGSEDYNENPVAENIGDGLGKF